MCVFIHSQYSAAFKCWILFPLEEALSGREISLTLGPGIHFIFASQLCLKETTDLQMFAAFEFDLPPQLAVRPKHELFLGTRGWHYQ